MILSRPIRRSLLLLPALFAGLSCSDATGPATRHPATLAIRSGDRQFGVVGDTLAHPIAVLVRDARGSALAGAVVAFAVTSGAGQLLAGTDTTDAEGIASADWILGTSVADSQYVEARVDSGDAGGVQLLVRFHARAIADAPAHLEKIAGDSQTTVVRRTLAIAPRVRMTDRFGNPTPNRGVIFRRDTADGWRLEEPLQASAGTDSAGFVELPWTLGSRAGLQTLTVSSIYLEGVELHFTATAIAGAAARLVAIASPPSDPVASGTTLAGQYRVAVADAEGNRLPLSGLAVHLSGTQDMVLGGATDALTDAEGVASFEGITVAGPVGTDTLVFSADGLASARLPLQLTVGAPARLAVVGADSVTATVGSSVLATVRLTDGWGNPIANRGIYWSTSSSTVSASTDASGVAMWTWVQDTIVGTRTLLAQADGTGLTTTFTVTTVADVPSRLVAANVDIPFADVGALTTLPRVRLFDRFNNVVRGAGVTFAVVGDGGTLGGAQAVSDSLGWATPASWTPSTIADTSRVTATVTGTSLTAAFIARRLAPLFASAIAVGYQHACAIATDNDTYCWGTGLGSWLTGVSSGVGDGTTQSRPVPVRVATAARFVSIASGGSHSCALDAAGAAWCWGNNRSGQLGDGTTTSRLVPTAVQTSVRFKSLSLGLEHSCGVATDDRAWCWGDNTYGSVGDSVTVTSTVRGTDRLTPTAVAGGHLFRSIAAGNYAACGISTSDAAYCWGWARWYQIPVDSTSPSCGTWKCYPVPRLIADSAVADLDLGYEFGCLRAAAGTLSCWGSIPGRYQPRVPYALIPVAGGFSYASIALSLANICGLDSSGAAWCHGSANTSGTGTTGTAELLAPTPVAGARAYSAITADTWSSVTCAIESSSARVFCWGEGQLGTGASSALAPVGVVREP